MGLLVLWFSISGIQDQDAHAENGALKWAFETDGDVSACPAPGADGTIVQG